MASRHPSASIRDRPLSRRKDSFLASPTHWPLRRVRPDRSGDGALLSPFFDGFGQLVMVYMGREVKTIWAESKDAQARGRLVC